MDRFNGFDCSVDSLFNGGEKMNLLEVYQLDSIIGKIIQDPNQAGNLKLELEKNWMFKKILNGIKYSRVG